MKRVWKRPARVLSGLLLAAVCALPQAYTVSAKPGAVNYIEGNAFLNDSPIAPKNLKSVFLNINDTLSTQDGKAEVLLTPGLFLRLGSNSEIRMISPSLTDTKVEILGGEVMLEAAGLVKDNNVQIIDHGAYTTITKDGLYRFTADNPPAVSVLDGRADVVIGDKKVGLKKGHEEILAENAKPEKFDTKREDDLYAWSNVRSEYSAASSFRLAQNANAGGLGGFGAFGYNGFGPGWYWNNSFNSYAWLPGSGAFFSPFGYGFYSPAAVGYAPYYTAYLGRGGAYYNNGDHHWHHHPGAPTTGTAGTAGTGGIQAAVPVRPSGLGFRGAGPAPVSSLRTGSISAPSAHVSNAGSSAGHMGGGGGFSGAHVGGGSSSGAGGHATSGGGHR